MLTYQQLSDLPEAIVALIGETERAIIADMARRIASMGGVTDTTQWQALRLELLGTVESRILETLSAALNRSQQELINLFDEAAMRSLALDEKIYKAAGYSPVPLSENAYLQQLIRAGLEKTKGAYRNLTNTTAITATRQFQDALDLAYSKIASGAFSYQEAIKAGIKTLTQNGLASIGYGSGHTDWLDVAFRRATLTGVNQTCAEIQLANAEQLGADLVETTAHHGARPDHAEWQGQVFSISGTHPKYPSFYEYTGYGYGWGLCGWNCRHSFFPFFEGLSERAYDAETLRGYNDKTVEFDGKEMSLYDATQQQRYIERGIRRWKREASAMEAAGVDSSYAQAKVREWQARQRDFVSQTGLTRDYFRERAGKQNA
ncbi:MAG: phage minor capsid protein [Clostridiales bacterium]|nr:phage minor capsid protein [Clostridiales bacterium]